MKRLLHLHVASILLLLAACGTEVESTDATTITSILGDVRTTSRFIDTKYQMALDALENARTGNTSISEAIQIVNEQVNGLDGRMRQLTIAMDTKIPSIRDKHVREAMQSGISRVWSVYNDKSNWVKDLSKSLSAISQSETEQASAFVDKYRDSFKNIQTRAMTAILMLSEAKRLAGMDPALTELN